MKKIFRDDYFSVEEKSQTSRQLEIFKKNRKCIYIIYMNFFQFILTNHDVYVYWKFQSVISFFRSMN